MKCMGCGRAEYVLKKLNDSVDLDGGPTVIVSGLKSQVCPKCGDVLLDAATSRKRTLLILAALVQRYSPSLQIPGKVGMWMRKAIDLTATEWAKDAGGVDPSAFSQAASRNTMIDRYSSFVLLCKVAVFISGSPRAGRLIQETHELTNYISDELLSAVKIA